MIMRRIPFTITVSFAIFLLGFAGVAGAQSNPNGAPPAAGAAAAPQRPRGPRPAPTNIKALPKDISGDDLIKLMRQYESSLGVECEYCHAKNPATGRNDFASDANPIKDRSRIMIRMTHEINATSLAQLTNPAPANPVTCGTCHQGMAKPAVFVPKSQERTSGPGATPNAAPPTAPK